MGSFALQERGEFDAATLRLSLDGKNGDKKGNGPHQHPAAVNARRLPGCAGSRVHGFTGSRVHGFLGTGEPVNPRNL